MTDKTEQSEATQAAPSIYDFVDYRQFLNAIFAFKKSNRKTFSLRSVAKAAGFASHSFLRMVMLGDRNLTPSSIIKLAKVLKLNNRETRYFEVMVFYNQADSESDKDRYFTDLLSTRPGVKLKGLEKDQFEYVTNSLYVTIREMSALPGFKDDIDWISQRLMRPALPSQILQALTVLKRLKLITRNENGQYQHSGKALETPPRIESLQIFNAHRNILSEGKDLILKTPHEETEVTSMTLPVNAAALPKIFEVLQKCREDIIGIINNTKTDFENVFQINMQIFPVTHAPQSISTLNDDDNNEDNL